ncbi:MAG: toll/interleukin-1 receptor domain-containing protein, partial [Gammaproteobacteria bacterium]|nr:toll/interleukin-1 receptor domain-containing protein [Gammaproteobacteria bacterium]
MKAFFSYSSSDSHLVESVYQALEPSCVWLDHAELNWGDRFIEKIESAVEKISHFVLFWSNAASQSEWVALELDMAFIRAMKERAVRICIVRLDDTQLPLRLQPFQNFSVFRAPNPVEGTIEALREMLSQPGAGVRHRFLNRNENLERIETMINHPETKIIILQGFMGSGKTVLAKEALRRFFEDASIVEVPIKTEVGPTELAL